MNEASCALILAEHRARFVDERADRLSGHELLETAWVDLGFAEAEDLKEFVLKYAGADNYADGTAKATVVNPYAEGRGKTGTYRLVSVFFKYEPFRGGMNGPRHTLNLHRVLRLEGGGQIAAHAAGRGAQEDEDRIMYADYVYPVNAPAASAGGLYSATNQFTADGLYNATLAYERGKAAQVEFQAEATVFRRGREILYANWPVPIEAPDWDKAGLYTASNNFNRFSLYDGRLVYRFGTGAAAAEYAAGRGVLEDRDAGLYRDQAAPVQAPECEAGGVYEANNQLTEDGLYNGGLVYERGKPAQVEFQAEATVSRRGREILYANWPVPIEAPDWDKAGLYTASNNFNRFSLYDGRLVYKFGTGAAAAEYAAGRGVLEDRDAALYRDQAAPIQAPACEAGGVYEANNQLTEDGLYNGGLLYRRGKEMGVYFTWPTRWGTAGGWLYENAAQFPDMSGLPAAASNSVEPGVNDMGLYAVKARTVPTERSIAPDDAWGAGYDHLYFPADGDDPALYVEHLRTYSENKAYDFARGETVGGHTMLGSLLVPRARGKVTEVFDKGRGRYKAVRVSKA